MRLLMLGSLLALGLTYRYYARISGPRVLAETAATEYLEIPRGTTLDSLATLLQRRNYVDRAATFLRLAERLGYTPAYARRGRFAVTPGMDLADLIRHLKNGKQAPVMVVLTTEREPADVAAKFLPASDYERAVAVDYAAMEKAQSGFGERYLSEVK